MIVAKFKYLNKGVALHYLTKEDIAYKEGGKMGRFQELPLLERIRSMGLKGVFIDGGANVGNHSVFFHNYCDAEHVFVIEAHPHILKLTTRTLERNNMKKASLHNVALGDGSESWVYMSKIPAGNAGRTHVVRDIHKAGVKVACTTIDDLWEGWKSKNGVALIKLDVEGEELRALRGSENVIRNHHPVIVAEHQTAIQLEAVRELLEPYGYSLDPVKFEPHGWTRIWIPKGLFNRG